MSVDFYTLSKKRAKVLNLNGRLETVHFLRLVIRNALSQDAQGIVDAAIESALREWGPTPELPNWVVQVGWDGKPGPGSPIFKWRRGRRLYCFDDELLHPAGYLGERELGGFHFRAVKEQEYLNDLATARKIDEGNANVFKDFWAGETFKTGREFLDYRRGGSGSAARGRSRHFARGDSSGPALSPKLHKIVCLIRFIESKGNRASSADLQFLGCLRSKAAQLGYGPQCSSAG